MKNLPTNPNNTANTANNNQEAIIADFTQVVAPEALAKFKAALQKYPDATRAIQEAYNKAYDALLDNIYRVTETLIPDADDQETINAFLTEELETIYPETDKYTSML